MTRRPTQPTRKIASRTTVSVGLAFLLALAASGAQAGANDGTIKVHGPDDAGDEANDPQVGCPFYVEGFNLDATNGTLVIKSWEPTGNMSVVVNTTWVADDVMGDDFADHHFLNGPFNLTDGHYKLFVSDHPHDKQKVFWVECVDEGTNTTTSTTGTTTSQGNTSTAPVPFFTTGTALVLGVAGSVAGALFMLRRRM